MLSSSWIPSGGTLCMRGGLNIDWRMGVHGGWLYIAGWQYSSDWSYIAKWRWGVFQSERSQCIQFSSCVRVKERVASRHQLCAFIRLVHKPSLQVDLIEVLCVSFPCRWFDFCRFLTQHCLHQCLEFFPNETTAPAYEFRTTLLLWAELFL